MTTHPPAWRVRDCMIALDHPVLLGIVNVTPDSFSDGGRFASADDAVRYGERMLGEGADIIDIGGESTRPQGATPVSVADELARVLPVVAALRRRNPSAVLSVDTVKSEVAEAVLAEGADIINDVSAFRLDPRMAACCAGAGAGVILMHSRGSVSDMATYRHAQYDNVVEEVCAELGVAAERAREAGIAADSIVLDPGIGFAKTGEHSLALLRAIPRIADLGYSILVGVSRKRFIGDITGVRIASERVAGTVGANVAAFARGARLFRVHDIRPNREALDVAMAVDEGHW